MMFINGRRQIGIMMMAFFLFGKAGLLSVVNTRRCSVHLKSIQTHHMYLTAIPQHRQCYKHFPLYHHHCDHCVEVVLEYLRA